MRIRRLAALVSLWILTSSRAFADPAALHEPWGRVLRERVDAAGRVAYRTMAKKDGERVTEYVRSLAPVDPSKLSRDDAVAFWINAYNAAVVLAVLHGETPETLEGRARMFEWFRLDVAGAHRRIDDLRAVLDGFAKEDPRIRFALCDGAVSSPRLAPRPYLGDRLDADLRKAARTFARDPKNVSIDLASKHALLSPLYGWYRKDFEGRGETLAGFLAKVVRGKEARRRLAAGELELRFGEYDWSLNAATGERPNAPKPVGGPPR